MGPTASGKSDLAIALAKVLPCEIISVDSAMVYRDMNIGTGKPSKEILAEIPHHLIDIRDASESYSAEDFRVDALAIIETIIANNKIPLLVGGTMLYFKALLQGLDRLPSKDEKIRQKLLLEKKQLGLPSLYQRLKIVDPDSAIKIHPNDPQRILRALEVYEITQMPLSKLQKNTKNVLPYNILQIAICPTERQFLHNKIAARFEKMLELGFIDEVRKLFQCGNLSLDLPSTRCVGYRQIWQYLQGDYDFETMKNKAIIATRQLAKRQLTWLRSWGDLYWFDSEDNDLIQKVERVINQNNNYEKN
jgi:tRNA dimethylallyltransferase